MGKTRMIRSAAGCLLILVVTSSQVWGIPVSTEKAHWTLNFGLGYMHTMGGIRTVWNDRIGELEMGIGYYPSASWGVELAGILGLNSMTEFMKNSIAVYNTGSGTYGHQSSWGGIYTGLLLGPKYRRRVSASGWSIQVGFGGHYYGEREAGINAENYFPRWTFGWGYYGTAGVFREKLHSRYGFQIRYIQARAKVNDFYYDRYYGKDSYDEIPVTYENDQRLIFAFVMGF